MAVAVVVQALTMTRMMMIWFGWMMVIAMVVVTTRVVITMVAVVVVVWQWSLWVGCRRLAEGLRTVARPGWCRSSRPSLLYVTVLHWRGAT